MVPDYYAMLGVEPTADREALDAALARQQPVWSSGTRNPKNKHTFQSYLDQIPAIRRVLLGDPTARAAYDAELAAARRAERDATLDALQRLVRLRAAKGGLTVGDRDLLRGRARELGLTSDDLDRLIASIPPKPEAVAPVDDDPPDPPVDVLDATTRRQIRVALEHLRRRDLYDALGLSRDAPIEELSTAADAERQRWMRKAQVTAEKTAWLELVSLAQSHLTSPANRARYDRTLGQEAEDAFRAAAEFALKGLPRLDPGTRALLLDESAALGIVPDRAARLLARACKALSVAPDVGIAAVPGVVAVASRMLRCRSCAGVTDFASVARSKEPACRHCSAALRWECPSCGALRWVDEPRCGCGFRVERVEPVARHFEAAQEAFRARDLDRALEHLERVRELAPKHDGARKGIEKVRARRAAIDRARADYASARAGGQLVAARAALEAWGALIDTNLPEWIAAWHEVTRLLCEARALVARARVVERTDPTAARALYRQGVGLAADLPEASSGLLRCPPDPPPTLQAEAVGDRIRLHWTAPEPDGLGPVSYVVVRKLGGALEHPLDGTRIAEVAGTEFEDVKVAPGASYGYAVVSRRGSAESIAASAVGPILLLADVSNVRAEARSGEVELSWTVPAGAHEVRVVRKRGAAPSGPKDGEPVEALRDRAVDRGLEDDRVYHYAIHAVYHRPDGRKLAAPGVLVAARPHPPVPTPEAPRLAIEPTGAVRLDWPKPARGALKVLRTARPLAAPPGARLPAAEAEALGGSWLEPIGSDAARDPTPPALGVCYYTPLLDSSGMMTVGPGIAYSCVPDPTDLRVTRASAGAGRVHLRWRWSPQATQARVVARAGAAPTGPDDPEALKVTVHEGEYSRHGHATLLLPATDAGPWQVRVYSVAVLNGDEVVSPGLEPTARAVVAGADHEVTVSYSFRRPGLLGGYWSLAFRTEPPGAAIPPTALVARAQTVPLSIDDGEIVASFPAAIDGAVFPIAARIDLGRRRARVFLDPGAAPSPDGPPPVRLRHPEAEPARV